ncbi:MAG: hypothetical protein LBB67_08155 [Oscillospiraceae bacterium]|nr:hypothetical protein [Oscillospiraceae bacterium]
MRHEEKIFCNCIIDAHIHGMLAVMVSASANVTVTITRPVLPLVGTYDCKAKGLVGGDQTGLQVTAQLRQGSQVIEADTKTKSNATSLSVTTHASYSANPTSGFGRTISLPSSQTATQSKSF